MKYSITILTVFLFAMSASVKAEDYKIGVVDLLRILEKAPQADEARKKIEEEFTGREAELSGMQKELVSMEEKLSKDRDTMNNTQLRELERDLISRRREIKRLQDEYREDLSYRRNEELAKLQKLIKETIQSLAKDEEYDLVLGEGLVYASPAIDLTDKVIEKLNEQVEDDTGDPGS